MSVPQVPFILFKGGEMPDVEKKKFIDKITNKPRAVPSAIVPIGKNNNWYKSLLISLKNKKILEKIEEDIDKFYKGTWLDDKTSINSIIEAYLTKDGNWNPEAWGSKEDLIDIFKGNIKKLLEGQNEQIKIGRADKPPQGFGKKVPRDVEELFGKMKKEETRKNFKGNYVFLPVAKTDKEETIYFIVANFLSPYFPTSKIQSKPSKKGLNERWKKNNETHVFQYNEFDVDNSNKKFLDTKEILINHTQKDRTIKLENLKIGSFIMKTREGKVQYLPFGNTTSKPEEKLLESLFITLVSDEAKIDETGLYPLSKEVQSIKPASILSIADLLAENEDNKEVKNILENIKLPKLSSKIEDNIESHKKRENSGSLMGTLSLDETREKYEENDKIYETELMKRLRESILRLIEENNKNFVEKKFYANKEYEGNAKSYIKNYKEGKWLYQQKSGSSIKMVSLRTLVSDFNKNKENSALNEIIKNMDTLLGGNNKSRKNRKICRNKTHSKH